MCIFPDFYKIKAVVPLILHREGGGFLKFPDMPPDLLHSYYGVCWLSMIAHDGFAPLLCAIGLSRRAVDTLPPAQREALCS